MNEDWYASYAVNSVTAKCIKKHFDPCLRPDYWGAYSYSASLDPLAGLRGQ